MKYFIELQKAIMTHNPIGVTIKEFENKLVLHAPNYSSHSAIFDPAFRFAEKMGIQYKGSGHCREEIYTITFTTKK